MRIPHPIAAVLISSAFVLGACGGGPSSPTETGPATFQISNPEAGARTDAEALTTIGDFRLTPGPAADGAIRLLVGESLVLNGNSYRQGNPNATWYLVANWGDGEGNQRIGCGPCRLTHVYTTPGRFTLQMTMDDGIVRAAQAMSPITESVTVIVESVPQGGAAPAPPVIVGNPPQATWSSIGVSCGPLTTTVVMRVTDADGDASSWTVTLTGGTLTSTASGGPVASGGTVTINFTGTVGLTTLRMDLVDSKGVVSTPVSRFGPANTCGGQILNLLG